jgi:hypothetical protein
VKHKIVYIPFFNILKNAKQLFSYRKGNIMFNNIMRRIRHLLLSVLNVASVIALLSILTLLSTGSAYAASVPAKPTHAQGKGALPNNCHAVVREQDGSSDGTVSTELLWSQNCNGKTKMFVSVDSTLKTPIHVVITSLSIIGTTWTNYDGTKNTNVFTTPAVETSNAFFFPTFKACTYIRGKTFCTDAHNSGDGTLYSINATE